MIERITKSEEMFDEIKESVIKLELALEDFEKSKKNLKKLKKYYHSRNWINDKNAYENNKIPKIKAGVLSEDGVWNMLEEIDELMIDMKRVFEKHGNNK